MASAAKCVHASPCIAAQDGYSPVTSNQYLEELLKIDPVI